MAAKKKVEPVVDYVFIYKGKDGDWYWDAKADNHKTVSDSSEGYRSRAYAVRMARSLNPGARVIFQ